MPPAELARCGAHILSARRGNGENTAVPRAMAFARAVIAVRII